MYLGIPGICCLSILQLLCIASLWEAVEGKRIYVDGNVIIGALFPVHYKGETEKCGTIWEEYGIQRIEAFLLALEQINNDTKLLPKIQLGCEIRDSCWYTPKALEETKEFVRSSFFSSQEMRCEGLNQTKPIAGVIGPGSSSVTEDVQNILAQFQIPEIGYSATSITLSNTKLYPYFLRVVAPDSQQARTMAELVHDFNWKYVSTLHSEGTYGLKGITQFKSKVTKLGVCIGAEHMLETAATEVEDLDDVIELLVDNKAATVVICFCQGEHVRLLLRALRKRNLHNQFTIIGSDGWNTRSDVVMNIEEAAQGSFSIQLESRPYPLFEQHYLSLRPDTNTVNPWFKEFWQEKFNCSFNSTTSLKLCTGTEDLSTNFNIDGKIGFVVDALYTAAHGLHDMITDHCSDETLCSSLMPLNGTLYYEYLKRVNFTTYSKKHFYFNKDGDPPSKYQVMNFQKDANGSYGYVQIATWERGSLIVGNTTIQWKGGNSTPPKSTCSEECEKGYAKIFAEASTCCWRCEKCDPQAILTTDEKCQMCEQGWWPNDNLTECMFIKVEYLRWNEVDALLPVTCAAIGITLAIGTLCIAAKNNDTPVVKASTRELSYLILSGIILAYLSTIAFVLKPTTVTCYITRILPGLSFSMVYGSVLTKTNRIARILARGKKKILTRKPHCMTTSSLVIVTVMLVIIELGIIVAVLIIEPAATEVIYPTANSAKLQCNISMYGILGPFGFIFLLIAMCTFYAVNTRNVPANFNEAKFIGFNMYVTCVIWIAFVPLYFGSGHRIITITLCISISATVALIFLFWPKAYIIVWRPERNTRGEFTTTTEVRCHIGRIASTHNNHSTKYSSMLKHLNTRRRRYGLMKSVSKHSTKTDDGEILTICDDLTPATERPTSAYGLYYNPPTVETRTVGCQVDFDGSCYCFISQPMWDISSEESCFSHGCANRIGEDEGFLCKPPSYRSLCAHGHSAPYARSGTSAHPDVVVHNHRRCVSLKQRPPPKIRLCRQRSYDAQLMERSDHPEFEKTAAALHSDCADAQLTRRKKPSIIVDDHSYSNNDKQLLTPQLLPPKEESTSKSTVKMLITPLISSQRQNELNCRKLFPTSDSPNRRTNGYIPLNVTKQQLGYDKDDTVFYQSYNNATMTNSNDLPSNNPQHRSPNDSQKLKYLASSESDDSSIDEILSAQSRAISGSSIFDDDSQHGKSLDCVRDGSITPKLMNTTCSSNV